MTKQVRNFNRIIEDAAHLMPPSGEGVNLAMRDALELSESLSNQNHKDLQTAIAAYEIPMRTRAAKAARDSMEMTAWMHAGDALEKMVQMLAK